MTMVQRLLVRVAPVLVLVLALAAPTNAADAPSSERAVAAVTELEHARQHAMVSADIARLAEICSEDLSYIHSNGLAQTRDDLFEMLTRGDIRYDAFRVESVSYKAFGTTVVGTGVQAIELTSSGKPFVSRSRYTVLYLPERGVHRLVSYQSTPLPEIVLQEKVGEPRAP